MAASSASAAQPPLAPGVLAEVKGVQGVVRVDERDGWRRLTIDGVTQGARRIDNNGAGGNAGANVANAVSPRDPLVELIIGARPKAKTALLIGLGTGKTAMDLASAGIAVKSVEIEPAVIDLARRFFGFTGEAVVGDGAVALKSSRDKFDVVVLDANTQPDATSPLLGEPLREAQKLVGDRGVVASRFVATPEKAQVIGNASAPYIAVFGSGVGNESQNVYLLSSGEPLEVIVAPGTAAFPIALRTNPLSVLRGDRTLSMTKPDANASGVAAESSRRVEITGYLVRLTEDGSIALDVAHAEMGAVRFLIKGAQATQELTAALATAKTFPTQGEIGSDGDVKGTLDVVLGGGGAMRSDVRFSSVIASVKGTARFRAAVDPDRVFGGKLLNLGPKGHGPTQDPAREKLLPYGGVLYDLDVDQIAWTLDSQRWAKSMNAAAPRLANASKSARDGNLIEAAKSVKSAASDLGSAMGSTSAGSTSAANVPLIADLTALAFRLEREDARWKSTKSAFVRGAACDRAGNSHAPWEGSRERRWPQAAVLEALRACARREYEKAITLGPKNDEARRAAERLHVIYTDTQDKDGEHRADMLMKQFNLSGTPAHYDPPTPEP